MISRFRNSVTSCLGPLSRFGRMNNRDDAGSVGGDEDDPLLWSRDLLNHTHGEFSFAIVQANENLEDQSQVVVGREATFVGVYDGHGGTAAAKYVSDHLFGHFLNAAQQSGAISEYIIRTAVWETEAGFLTVVGENFGTSPEIATVGSCCLVGAIWNGILYVGNLGDSRAVMGSLSLDGRNKMVAELLTNDDNASVEEVREQLQMVHPNDPQIVVLNNGVWRIKGIIQVSKAIGDWCLKRTEFGITDRQSRFHLDPPLSVAVLSADPSAVTRILRPNHRFIIFASDGLWEFLENQEAVDIVHKYPKQGIARRLIVAALRKAARARNTEYSEIKKLNAGKGRGNRREIHDDITVVVLFVDLERHEAPGLSVQGFTAPTEAEMMNAPANFEI